MYSTPELTPCKVNNPELWFSSSEHGRDSAYARMLCHRCPVMTECLEETLTWEREKNGGAAQYGIFGGLSQGQRNRIHRRAKRRVA